MTAAEPIVEPSRPHGARLRLVEAHEHTWHLRSVDFTDGVSVREFGCRTCDSVWFA